MPYTYRIFDSIDDVDLASWERVRAESAASIFTDPRFIAAAEAGNVGVFLTCDDRLLRCAKRNRHRLRVQVANPLDWLKEIGNGNDA